MEKGNKIVLVLGILAIAAAIFVYFEAKAYLEKAVLTEGKVVHVLGTTYRIQYYTSEGTEKIYYGSRKTHGLREGNTIKVWYRADNPDRARISDGKRGTRILFIIGVACLLLGISPLFLKKKGNSIST